MAKLYFNYGVMGSAKTTQLLTTNFSYTERGRKTILLSPNIDTRSGKNKIYSRIGIEAKSIDFDKDDDLYDLIQNQIKRRGKIDAALVDEAQFLTTNQVEQLAQIVDICDMDVLAYGLRSDFKSQTFEGSKRLLEIADTLIEIKALCKCGKKAIINSRWVNGNMTKKGEQVVIGDTIKDDKVSYVALCRKCWNLHGTQIEDHDFEQENQIFEQENQIEDNPKDNMVQVTKEMAFDAGDRKLEGSWINW